MILTIESFAQFNETIPTDYWVYSIIEELKVRGHFRNLPQGYKPYSRIEIAKAILAEKNKAQDDFQKKLFKMLEDEFADEIAYLTFNNLKMEDQFTLKAGVMLSEYAWRDGYSKRLFRFRGRAKFAFYYGDGVTLYNSSIMDQNLLDDTTYTGNRFLGFFAGYTEQGYLKLNFNPITVKFGRDYVKWGYGRGGNLIISDYAIPYDILQIDFSSKILKYSFLISQLDEREYSPDSGKTFLNAHRYLTGGRFELTLWNKLYVGFAQTILYGGNNRSVDITLSNPIAFYYEFQANEGQEMNGMLYWDLSYYPVKNLNLYAEFLIDDWQISRKTKDGLEPNEYGFIVGFKVADMLLIGSLAQFEYTQVRNRTYNTRLEYQKYLRFKRPIGHRLGNDFQSLELWLTQWLWNRLRLTLNYKFIEHGEGSIEKPWDEPWMAPEITVETGYKEKFPYGIVERTHQLGINLFYYFSSKLNLNLELSYANIKNYRNVKGARKGLFTFKAWVFFNFDKILIN
ncbi:MAG: capsule assembly Wzi family protein [Candidatus Kryptonium sp.]|nr:capsule assembly Wzi family protein [Candidatus Kryptonium sp.]